MIEVVDLTKLKPVRGLVTVELFNKSGKKIKEIKSENMITTLAKNHLLWDMKEDFFRGCPGTLPAEPSYSFNNIILTTSDIAPQDVDIPFIGSLIGWSDKSTYSGSDTLRGTLNTVESYATNDKVHWVFDFPTHAGNGTIRTIMWGNIVKDSIYGTRFAFDATTNLWDNTIYQYGITRGDDCFWLCGLNSTNNRFFWKINLDLTIAESYPYLEGIGYDGIAWGNGYLWAARGTSIVKVNVTNWTVIDTLNLTIPIVGITWHDGILWVISTDDFIYKINPSNGEIIGNIVKPAPNIVGIVFDNNGLLWAVRDNSEFFTMDINNNKILNAVSAYPISSWQTSDIWINEDNTIGILPYRGQIKYNRLQYGARTLLPQPITKTSNNTMKVTYDFVF